MKSDGHTIYSILAWYAMTEGHPSYQVNKMLQPIMRCFHQPQVLVRFPQSAYEALFLLRPLQQYATLLFVSGC
jgi:hypothetical protein